MEEVLAELLRLRERERDRERRLRLLDPERERERFLLRSEELIANLHKFLSKLQNL